MLRGLGLDLVMGPVVALLVLLLVVFLLTGLFWLFSSLFFPKK